MCQEPTERGRSVEYIVPIIRLIIFYFFLISKMKGHSNAPKHACFWIPYAKGVSVRSFMGRSLKTVQGELDVRVLDILRYQCVLSMQDSRVLVLAPSTLRCVALIDLNPCKH